MAGLTWRFFCFRWHWLGSLGQLCSSGSLPSVGTSGTSAGVAGMGGGCPGLSDRLVEFLQWRLKGSNRSQTHSYAITASSSCLSKPFLWREWSVVSWKLTKMSTGKRLQVGWWRGAGKKKKNNFKKLHDEGLSHCKRPALFHGWIPWALVLVRCCFINILLTSNIGKLPRITLLWYVRMDISLQKTEK